MIFMGIPMVFIELTIGQYSGSGPLTVWEVGPLFQGLGFGMLVYSFIYSISFNIPLSWTLYYMFASWQNPLPWSHCNHSFNTLGCYPQEEQSCKASTGIWNNQTCHYKTDYPDNAFKEVCSPIESSCINTSYNEFWENLMTKTNRHRRFSPSHEYYMHGVLGSYSLTPLEEPGYPKWDLTLTLLLSWAICFLCLLKGIRSLGKVMCFTAIFPVLLIVILGIRAAFLPGSMEGALSYIAPDLTKIKKAEVWRDAATHVFWSLHLGTGGLMTLASYNTFTNRVYRDALLVPLANYVTSIVSGFAVFAFLGYLAHMLGKDVAQIASAGPSLSFIVFPEVMTLMENPQLWSTLFFAMLFTIGLGSQLGSVLVLSTGVLDTFPRTRKYKAWINLALCGSLFLLGLTMCTRAGAYWVHLLDIFTSWPALVLYMLQAIIFPLVYIAGARRLEKNIEHMVGFRLGPYWFPCLMLLTCPLLCVVFVAFMKIYAPYQIGRYVLPSWARALGWCMAAAPLVFLPVVAVVRVIYGYWTDDVNSPNKWEPIARLCQPTDLWGPSIERAQRIRAAKQRKMYETNRSDRNVAEFDMQENAYPRGSSNNPTYVKDPQYTAFSRGESQV